MSEWVNLITNVGFPIFCCICLFKQNRELRESIDALKGVLQKALDKLERAGEELENKE